MRIFVASDIHQEFRNKRDPDGDWFFQSLGDVSDVDVCVLAGDIYPARNSHQFLRRISDTFKHTVYVAGNHEHYQGDFDWTYRELRRMADEYSFYNFHFLEKETVEIDGQRFVGCTLWYPHSIDAVLLSDQMNDFKMIHRADGKRSFRSTIFDYAHSSHDWLKETVKEGDVVVTHMLPTEAAVSKEFKGDRLNCFYFHNCESIIEHNKPKLWIHGHSHQPIDTMIFDTRLIRNPVGYPKEPNTMFNKDLRIVI